MDRLSVPGSVAYEVVDETTVDAFVGAREAGAVREPSGLAIAR